MIKTMSIANYLNHLAYLERKERYIQRKGAMARMDERIRNALRFLLGGKKNG